VEHARTRTRKRATGRVASHRPLVIQHFLLESSSTVLVRDEIPYRRQRRLHLRANPTPDISHLGRLSWLLHLGLGFGLGKLEKSAKQKQYWILKCLQGGRDHPLAGMWGGDALLPSTGADGEKPRNICDAERRSAETARPVGLCENAPYSRSGPPQHPPWPCCMRWTRDSVCSNEQSERAVQQHSELAAPTMVLLSLSKPTPEVADATIRDGQA
jgi:hypothetical protein